MARTLAILRRMKTLFVLVVILFGSLATGGQNDEGTGDGDELLPMCKTAAADLNEHHRPEENAFSEGYCLGLVTGVSETSDDVCSLGVPSGQLAMAVVKFLEDHPDRLNLKNTTLIRQALVRTWPCKRK
jgi:Rap1a immunity proteins